MKVYKTLNEGNYSLVEKTNADVIEVDEQDLTSFIQYGLELYLDDFDCWDSKYVYGRIEGTECLIKTAQNIIDNGLVVSLKLAYFLANYRCWNDAELTLYNCSDNDKYCNMGKWYVHEILNHYFKVKEIKNKRLGSKKEFNAIMTYFYDYYQVALIKRKTY